MVPVSCAESNAVTVTTLLDPLLGVRFVVVPQMSVADGINAARMTIPRMWFDAKKTALGVDALRQYREKVDEKRGIALGPLHDWTSHAADAFRYLAMGWQVENKPAHKKPRDMGGWMAA
mgnify:CR=1 FL=1